MFSTTRLALSHAALLAVCLAAGPGPGLLADHPFHASRAVADFNPETTSIEVSLCVFPDDLILALSQRQAGAIDLDDAPRLDQLAAAYVRDHFQITCDGREIPLQWVGHEIETQQVWLYFEFPLKQAPAGAVTISNSIMFHQFDDQANDVVLTIGQRCRTLTFRPESPRTVEFSLAGRPRVDR
jgi:hypothetical protein